MEAGQEPLNDKSFARALWAVRETTQKVMNADPAKITETVSAVCIRAFFDLPDDATLDPIAFKAACAAADEATARMLHSDPMRLTEGVTEACIRAYSESLP